MEKVSEGSDELRKWWKGQTLVDALGRFSDGWPRL